MAGKKDQWGFWIRKYTPELVGKTFENNKGQKYTVINRLTMEKYLLVFHETGYITSITNSNIKRGAIKDLYAPSVHGVGYIGVGVSKHESSTSFKAYTTWNNMLRRCYSGYKECYNYEGCTVDPKWHCFQNFFLWFEKNYKEGFHLDKDILSKQNNKVYSDKTCEFIPQNINKLFTDTKLKRGSYPQGVHYYDRNRKFIAQICMGRGVAAYIGSYETAEDAYIAYSTRKMEVASDILKTSFLKGDISLLFYNKSLEYFENHLNGGYK